MGKYTNGASLKGQEINFWYATPNNVAKKPILLYTSYLYSSTFYVPVHICYSNAQVLEYILTNNSCGDSCLFCSPLWGQLIGRKSRYDN